MRESEWRCKGSDGKLGEEEKIDGIGTLLVCFLLILRQQINRIGHKDVFWFTTDVRFFFYSV